MKDYFICLGINYKTPEFPKKTFYWRSNNNFAELPSIDDKIICKIAHINTLFTGEHDNILAQQDGESKELFLDEDDALPIIIKPKPITELDRLSYVVNRIEAECHIIPVGSVKFTPIHEVRPNEAFKGLNFDDSQDLSKYAHFAPITTKEMKE